LDFNFIAMGGKKMGEIRPVVLLGVAVIIAIIITLFIYTSIQKRIDSKAPPLETQPIAMATIDLDWGTVILKEMVKMEPFLKSSLPVGAYTDMNSLIGRVVISSIKANEPFLESRMAAQNIKTGGVAAIIGSKKRAVTVKVDKVIGVAGFVHPGNRVDVLVTMAKGKDAEPFTKMVLENILVLAAGPERENTKGKEPAMVDVITLEVTPEEAEKLSLSAIQGKMQLALRGLTDAEVVLTKGISIPSLLASYSGSGPVDATKRKTTREASAANPIQTKRKVFVVELIQGGKVTSKNFEEGK
jgi:pilus assembly protein CpaB